MITLKFASPEQLNTEAGKFTRNHPLLSDPLFTEDHLTKLLATISSSGPFLNATKFSASATGFPRSVVVLPSAEGRPRVFALLTKTKLEDLVLGSGSYSKVKATLDLCTATIAAVSSTRFKTPSDSQNADQYVKALQDCQSPYVIPLYGHYKEHHDSGEPKKILIFMKYCRYDLTEAMKDYSISDRVNSLIIRQIVQAVRAVHSRGYVHADIKPPNILVDLQGSESRFYLGDFSLTAQHHSTNCGTAEFAAPELANGAHVNRSTDFWSLGCTFYKLFTNRPLIDQLVIGLNPRDALLELLDRSTHYQLTIKAVITRDIPEAHRPLLVSLLQLNPTLRGIPPECFPETSQDSHA